LSSKSDDRLLPSPDDIRSPVFRRVLDAVPTGLVIVDLAGKIAFANTTAEGMLLYERNQLQGQSIQALVPAAGRPEHSARVDAFLKNPVRRSMGMGRELTALRRDGTEFPVEIGLNPLPTSDGTWVLASIVDVTEWKRLVMTSREQHERVRAYWEATSEGLITVDISGNIEMVNKATERIFGYDRAELVGQPIEILIPEVYRGVHEEKRAGYFAEPKLRPMGIGRDLYGRRKDGTQFPVEVGLNEAKIGQRTIAIGFVTDISEKRQLQEQSAVLETLVDLQQQLATSQRKDAANDDSDPLTGLDTRPVFDKALEKASVDPKGLNVVVYSIPRMEQMRARFGTKMADRIVFFVSQYIGNTLKGEGDQLYRWKDSTFVAFIRRDSSALLVDREVTEACGKKLEYFVDHASGSSLVMIALSVKVLPLAQVSLAEITTEIERFARLGAQ